MIRRDGEYYSKNRNPAAPKRIMLPCTCASHYHECNCEWLRSKSLGARPAVWQPHVYIPLMIFSVCVLIVGLRYLFGG